MEGRERSARCTTALPKPIAYLIFLCQDSHSLIFCCEFHLQLISSRPRLRQLVFELLNLWRSLI